MKESFKNYLESIGITSRVIIDRVEEILALVVDTGLMKQVDDIYVGEHLWGDGTRVYESLLMFSGDRMVQAVDFLYRDQLKIAPGKAQLGGLEIEANNYDFKRATVRSRLKVQARGVDDELAVDGEATRENCDQLKNILQKYWMPNVRP